MKALDYVRSEKGGGLREIARNSPCTTVKKTKLAKPFLVVLSMQGTASARLNPD